MGYDLAEYLKQFGLTVADLEDESGRGRNTLYTWYKKDKQILMCIIRSRLSNKLQVIAKDIENKLSMLER